MKCHQVFHVSLLEPIAFNPRKGQQRPPPPPISIQDKQECEAEEVVDSKLINNKL